MRSTAVFALLFLLVAAGLRGQDNPAWTEQHGAFAFPDAAGTRLLSTADISTPELLQTALCSGDRRLAVRFERRQAESVTSSHRQAPHNFDNTAGSVFRIVDAKVDPAATCFLAVDSFLRGGHRSLSGDCRRWQRLQTGDWRLVVSIAAVIFLKIALSETLPA
jgi:hypothetical protein